MLATPTANLRLTYFQFRIYPMFKSLDVNLGVTSKKLLRGIKQEKREVGGQMESNYNTKDYYQSIMEVYNNKIQTNYKWYTLYIMAINTSPSVSL